MVDGAALEKRSPHFSGAWVRIPPSPLYWIGEVDKDEEQKEMLRYYALFKDL